MLAILGPYPLELLVILIVFLLLFGNRLPSIMRSLGSSVNEFKKGMNESAPDANAAPPQQAQAPAPPVAAPPAQAPAAPPAATPVQKQMP
ncbi:twin-arginine translocase TatA/TatE family subunit [bacterium]|nr:twin-arginine translocase TatA/TatE family subunit [bacterium]